MEEHAKNIFKKHAKRVGNNQKCHHESYDCSYYSKYLSYSCSLDCRRTKNSYCSTCSVYSNFDSNEGTCEHKNDDSYSEPKSCLADNLILKWKRLNYQSTINKRYTHIKNVVSENEECPNNMKVCALLTYIKINYVLIKLKNVLLILL